MKKILILTVMCLFVIFSMTSCITAFLVSEAQDKERQENGEKPYNYMVSLVGIDENEVDSAWEKDYYVDEFGNPTNEPFIKLKDYYARGHFSNSATNSSSMSAKFLVNKNTVGIELFEYSGMYPVTGLSSEYAYIKIQTEDGSVYELKPCSFILNNKRIIVRNEYYNNVEILFKAFSENDSVKFRIEVKGSYSNSSIYNFTLDTRGFVQTYLETFSGD